MAEDLEGIDNPGSNEAVAKRNAASASFAAIGVSGLERYGGYIQEEFLTTLQMPNCLKVYKEMSLNDPTIGAMLFMFEQLARRVTWRIEPAGAKSIDKQIAEFVESCRKDTSHSWQDLITEILSYFVYGWAWHEIVYKIRRGNVRDPKYKSRFNDGKIGWRKIPGRSQDSWDDWKFNETTDELEAMVQVAATSSTARTIPIGKSLLFRTNANRGNPESISLLRRAYKSWYYKKHIEGIEAIGIERDLAGLPQIIVPDGVNIWNTNDSEAVALKATLEKIVSNVRRDKNEGIILPFGYEFKLATTGGRRQIDTNAVINRYDQRIAITMLADIVMLGADKVGSFALADVKKSLLAAALEAQIVSIAEIFNKYAIPRLVDLNNFKGFTDYPKLVASEVETPDINNLGDFLIQLRDLGVNLFPDEKLESYIRSVANLPEKSEEKKAQEKKEEKEKEKEEKEGGTIPEEDDAKAGELEAHNKPKQSDDKTKFNALYEREGRK